MAESIFTKIIRGEIPCHKVYEDDKTIAFLDIHPVNPGHTLVVPKQEIDHFDDLPEPLYQHVMRVVQKLSKRIKRELRPERIGLVVIGVDVPHAHIHVIPLKSGQEIKLAHDMNAEPDHNALADTAAKIRI